MENKNHVFVIPEMLSKTFVIVFKKIPDHFNMNVMGHQISKVSLLGNLTIYYIQLHTYSPKVFVFVFAPSYFY